MDPIENSIIDYSLVIPAFNEEEDTVAKAETDINCPMPSPSCTVRTTTIHQIGTIRTQKFNKLFIAI